MEYFITNYGTAIIGLILCAIFGCLGNAIKKIYQTYVNDITKQSIAKSAAQFVEQAWKILHGADKLAKTLETAEALLKKKGIAFDADEMIVLIEAAVAEFNEAFKKPLQDEGSAGGTYRVDETEGNTFKDTVVSGFLANMDVDNGTENAVQKE